MRAPRNAASKRSFASLAGNSSLARVVLRPMSDPYHIKPDPEKFWANVLHQHATLGEFVESFELMVNEGRETAIDLVTREAPDATDYVHRKLVEVAFHHPAITAKPAFEIMRALIADYLKQNETKTTFKEREAFSGVLSELASEYFSLVNMRNSLLHGTWHVGFVSPGDPHSSTFQVTKYKPTKTGLAKEATPTDADGLRTLTRRCHVVRSWLGEVRSCLPTYILPPKKITESFVFGQGRWRFILGDGTPEALP
jgi:hypothetical protein